MTGMWYRVPRSRDAETLSSSPVCSRETWRGSRMSRALSQFTVLVLALFALAAIVLMVHPSVPAHDMQELIALAKKAPGTINFASAGNGTTNHLSGELFKSMANIDIVHVPYRGAGPAMNDLIAGHVQMFFDLMPVVLPQIAAGKVRALANAGAKRPSALPDVPTVAEQGLSGFDASSWYGLVAPPRR